MNGPHTRRLSTSVVSIALALSILIQPLAADAMEIAHASEADQALSVAGVAALSGVLDQLQARVQAIINDATNQANNLILALGQQIQSQITLAQQLLHTELTFQEQQLEEMINGMISNIRQAIEDLEQQTFAKVQDFINQAQLIAMGLPFSNKAPMLRGFTPVVAFPTASPSDDLSFTVTGVFPDVGHVGYNPTLVLNILNDTGVIVPNRISSSNTTNLSAQFNVKAALLFSTSPLIRRVDAQVIVPHRKRCFLLFHCRAQDAVFNETIALLPKTPGTLKVTFRNTAEQYENKVRTSYVINANASDGDHHDQEKQYPADSGYEIDPTSVRISVLSAAGDWNIRGGNCSTGTMACWKVTTIQHHCVFGICPQGGDGVVNFKLSFSERILTTRTTTSDPVFIPIAWNQESSYTFPGAGVLDWDAVYVDFASKSAPFGSQNLSLNSPYLKVTKSATRTWCFAIYPFNTDVGADVTSQTDSRTVSAAVRRVTNVNQWFSANVNPMRLAGFQFLKSTSADAFETSRFLAGLTETVEAFNLQISAPANANVPVTGLSVATARDTALASLRQPATSQDVFK